jgi:PAS domain S-box-containing protein
MTDTNPMPSPVPQSPAAFARFLPALNLSRVLVLVGFLVVTAAIVLAAFFISSLYDSELKAIRNRLEIPAHAIAQLTQATARIADLALVDIQVAAVRQDPNLDPRALAGLQQMLIERDRTSVLIGRIAIYDAAGKLVVDSVPGRTPAISIADCSCFERQIQAPRNEMLISELVADPRDGKETFVASRPLYDHAGKVRGVIAVYLSTKHLQGYLDSLQMPPGTTLTLFNLDGRQLVRSPAIHLGDRALDIDFSKQGPFRALLDGTPDGGFAEFTNVVGKRRFYAQAGGPDTGFVIAAAWDADAALAQWQRAATMVVAGTAAGIIVILALFAYIVKALRRNDTLLTEVSLRAESLRDLVAAMPDAVFLIDSTLQIVFANPAAERLYGFGPSEMNGIPLRDVSEMRLAPTDERNIRRVFSSINNAPSLEGAERVSRRKDGSLFPVEISARPYQSKNNRLIVAVHRDVTRRKADELALRRSRENMAQAQQIAAIGSFERNLTTGETEWSEEIYRILGLDKTKVSPKLQTVLDLIHPDDRARFIAARAATAQGTPAATMEFRIIRPDGAERIIRRETGVVLDDEKRPIRVYGSYQDVTDRRAAETRERELERQLLHSQKLEALGTLAGGIAHDLNNTLTPIMALSKVAARRLEPGSPVRVSLETIFEASQRAADLVKRVVGFSRGEESEKRETNIAETVNEALKLLRATVPSSITLEARIIDVPLIPADSSQIHQVVTNLITNASQAIDNKIGKITVTLDLCRNAAQQSEICLSVGDTGIGMDEQTQQRIFEPFFTTKAVGQGTGLGLSIVHGIVLGHGGRIEVNSEPGKGTRFELYFPVPAAASTVSTRDMKPPRTAA